MCDGLLGSRREIPWAKSVALSPRPHPAFCIVVAIGIGFMTVQDLCSWSRSPSSFLFYDDFSHASASHRSVFTSTKCRQGDYISSTLEPNPVCSVSEHFPNFLKYLRYTVAASQHCCYETQGWM